ncbi:MATE family efflux transporter [Psychrosphaera haliotis]|nr:MATE family efflux transporter [Psychrosphaera haliotis]
MGSQLIDSAFVGQLGAQPLAVLGYSIPIYQVVIGIQVGLGIAATASISNALGSSNRAYAKSLGSIILLIGTIVITLLCIGLWLFQEPIAIGLGAETRTISSLERILVSMVVELLVRRDPLFWL